MTPSTNSTGHGGARPGAGRPKKTSAKPPTGAASRYESALAYLQAVALGREAPDGLRIAAAKAVLPYEAPKRRATVESPPPRSLRKKEQAQAESSETAAWNEKQRAIRAQFRKESKDG